MAVVFNRVYAILEPVKFSEVSWNKSCVGVFFLGTGKGVFFFWWRLNLLLSSFFFCLVSNYSNVYVVRITDKEAFNSIKFISVLVV